MKLGWDRLKTYISLHETWPTLSEDLLKLGRDHLKTYMRLTWDLTDTVWRLAWDLMRLWMRFVVDMSETRLKNRNFLRVAWHIILTHPEKSDVCQTKLKSCYLKHTRDMSETRMKLILFPEKLRPVWNWNLPETYFLRFHLKLQFDGHLRPDEKLTEIEVKPERNMKGGWLSLTTLHSDM